MGKLANKRQHKNENIMDSSDEKTKVSETHHCIGFDMPTANEAFNHFAGHLVVLEKYGDMCNEHTLHTWDDGYRELCQCTACGGLILYQRSEYHGLEDDDLYSDFFPVDSPEEAKQLNETYGGFAIETKWPGKKIFLTNGKISGKW